jgi:hypothetical protein
MAAGDGRPSSARNALGLAQDIAEGVLRKPVSAELLMTSVPPDEKLSIAHIHGMFAGRIPLRTLRIEHWPRTAPHLQCLHCGGPCDAGPPVPAAKHFESEQFWVYGPFCRPCCAFGYVCEIDSTSKQLALTVDLLRRFFGLKKIQVAPPRAAHSRFGGPLLDSDFYGESGYACLSAIQPPFVTFANYVVGVHREASGPDIRGVRALLPQSAGALVGLTRPTERHAPLAEKKPSGRSPLILEFLATLSSVKDVKDASEAIEVRAPKRKKAEPQAEQPNFLKQFVKKAAGPQ